eukprot:1158797-Pelagomonas_calceolata.AAC.6
MAPSSLTHLLLLVLILLSNTKDIPRLPPWVLVAAPHIGVLPRLRPGNVLLDIGSQLPPPPCSRQYSRGTTTAATAAAAAGGRSGQSAPYPQFQVHLTRWP